MRSTVIIFGLFAGIAGYVWWPRPITEDALAAQLSGGQCHFVYRDACAQRGLEPLARMFTEAHDCPLWAVECLAEFETPRAEEIMIGVLTTHTDVETCDGTVPVRTNAVRYLESYGSVAALGALETHLQSTPMSVLSRGASGCDPQPEDIQTIRDAIAAIKSR